MDAQTPELTRRPTIPYPGAKGRLAPMLVSLMPTEGRMYLEPFAGRGNVFFAAAQACRFTHWNLNDTLTAPFFNALRDLGGTVKVPQRTRAVYHRYKERFQHGDPLAALFEPYLTFSGGGYAKGGFGGKRSATADGYARTLRRCSELLRQHRVRITNVDWKLLRLDQLTQEDFVFLDPPYYGADVRAYSSENFDYAHLVDTLARAKFRWLLTEYRQPFYVAKLGKPCFEREVQLACDRIGTRSRIECCWSNYL